MKKILLVCAAMVTLVACNNSKVENDKDSTIDTDTPVANVPTEEPIKDSVEQMKETTFDFLDKNEWVKEIKWAVTYSRDHENITLDSAIKAFSGEWVPKDSIEKWWQQR